MPQSVPARVLLTFVVLVLAVALITFAWGAWPPAFEPLNLVVFAGGVLAIVGVLGFSGVLSESSWQWRLQQSARATQGVAIAAIPALVLSERYQVIWALVGVIVLSVSWLVSLVLDVVLCWPYAGDDWRSRAIQSAGLIFVNGFVATVMIPVFSRESGLSVRDGHGNAGVGAGFLLLLLVVRELYVRGWAPNVPVAVRRW